MAVKAHSLFHAIDMGSIIKEALSDLSNHEIEMVAYVDSWMLFNVVTKYSSTVERRLRIDVIVLEESYQKRDLKHIERIPGNLADVLGKEIIYGQTEMWRCDKTEKLKLDPIGWSYGRAGKRSLGRGRVPISTISGRQHWMDRLPTFEVSYIIRNLDMRKTKFGGSLSFQ